MRLFLDTNLFIDILLDREPFTRNALNIYKLCENGLAEGFIAPITVNNIHYICRKAHDPSWIKSYLSEITKHLDIATMNAHTVTVANKLKMRDYEDALQYAMALQLECDYLITRNTKDYKNLHTIHVATPDMFLQSIKM